MKIKSVVYRKGFVEIEFSRGGNVWATLVIKPKDIIANFHAAQRSVQATRQQRAGIIQNCSSIAPEPNR